MKILNRLLRLLALLPLFLGLPNHNGKAQDGSEHPEKLPPRFSVGVATGITFEGIAFGDRDLRNRSRDMMVAVEISPPVALQLDGSRWTPSVETGYAQVIRNFRYTYSSPTNISTGTGTSTLRQAPILAWLTVNTMTRLSPFIRGGIGISWVEFSREFESSAPNQITLRRWSFAWGIGGGLQYAISARVAVRLFLEDWIATGDLIGVRPDGFDERLPAPLKFTPVGFQFSYHFE